MENVIADVLQSDIDTAYASGRFGNEYVSTRVATGSTTVTLSTTVAFVGSIQEEVMDAVVVATQVNINNDSSTNDAFVDTSGFIILVVAGIKVVVVLVSVLVGC
jgi:hypothetical protein